jgi:hypothetical protein
MAIGVEPMLSSVCLNTDIIEIILLSVG